MRALSRLALTVAIFILGACSTPGKPPLQPVRFATFNVALNFPREGGIIEALAGGEYAAARKSAAIIQQLRPDVLLLNELDHDPAMAGLALYRSDYLARSQFGQQPLDYPYSFVAPVNTGLGSGVDLNGDGKVSGPADAHGYGEFPGQYGMVVLSRYPIDTAAARTFQKFLWRDLPGAWWPRDPETGEHYYSEAARAVLRLSSKSHWDVPILLPGGTVHLLASHPTPPVFDGPEDRNGRRNHDEIRFWVDYISGSDDLHDDQGRPGGLVEPAAFVIAGDLNADPHDGDSSGEPIRKLLDHPRIAAEFVPASPGAAAAAGSGINPRHRGDPAADTASFNDANPGNLRVDYVLPSVGLRVVDGGVFWPAQGDPGAEWLDASDHRLVWLDLRLPPHPQALSTNWRGEL